MDNLKYIIKNIKISTKNWKIFFCLIKMSRIRDVIYVCIRDVLIKQKNIFSNFWCLFFIFLIIYFKVVPKIIL